MPFLRCPSSQTKLSLRCANFSGAAPSTIANSSINILYIDVVVDQAIVCMYESMECIRSSMTLISYEACHAGTRGETLKCHRGNVRERIHSNKGKNMMARTIAAPSARKYHAKYSHITPMAFLNVATDIHFFFWLYG